MSAGLAFSTGAFVFGGLLTPMAASLDVSINAVAQLQAVFALACAVGGPTLAIALRKVDRKRLLIAVMLVLVVVNAASAVLTSYGALLAVRVAGGSVGALTLPLASALAVGLVAEVQRGRALATVSAGTAFAFLIGIPIGSLLGARLVGGPRSGLPPFGPVWSRFWLRWWCPRPRQAVRRRRPRGSLAGRCRVFKPARCWVLWPRSPLSV